MSIMTSAKKSDNGYNQRGYQFLCNLLNKKAAKSKAFDPHDFYLGVTHATVKIGFCWQELLRMLTWTSNNEMMNCEMK